MTPDDAALLKVFAGVIFARDATLTLPSGMVIGGDEANAYTAAYAPVDGLPDRQPPASLAETQWGFQLTDVTGWLTRIDHLEAQLKVSQTYGRQAWWVAMLFAGTASLALVLLIWALLSGAA